MKHLSNLRPAETWYLLNHEDATHGDLLRFTFYDLVLRHVFKLREISRQPSPRDAARTYLYVEAGKKFMTHQPVVHEEYFMSVPNLDRQGQILLRHLVKIVFQKTRSRSAYVGLVLRSSNLDDCFRKNFWQWFTSARNLTEKGWSMRQEVRMELDELNARLNRSTDLDADAQSLVKLVRGNVFLLDTIPASLLALVGTDLWKVVHQHESHDTGCTGCFSSHSDGCSGGASGCSGDSGCSGCGGCGGGD